MTTPILQITELAGSQIDQYVTANDAIRALEAATMSYLDVDLTSGNGTVSAANFSDYFAFFGTGHTVARTLTLTNIDSSVSPNVAIKRPFVVVNEGTAAITVTIGSTTSDVAANSAGIFYTDGTTNSLIAIASGGAAATAIVSPDTSTTHTATADDNGGLVLFDSSSDCTLTVPEQATEALTDGFFILARNTGGGNMIVALEGSDTIDGVKLWADPTRAVTIILETAGDLTASPNTYNDWAMIGNDWLPTVVEDHVLTAPPSTSPLNDVGTVYVVNTGSPAGAWASFTDGNLAVHLGAGAYAEIGQPDGHIVRTKDLSASPHNARLIYWDADAGVWSNV